MSTICARCWTSTCATTTQRGRTVPSASSPRLRPTLGHPNPVDLSRWTYAGLERLFDENGDWSAVLVSPAQGTAATLAMLNGQFAQLLCKRLRVQLMARPVVAALNWSGAALDRAIPILREPVPGSLNATFHIEAIA